MAQTFFNQGLRLTYAFNHAEAHRSFMEASRLDPNSAMTYWGQAYALGPNINDQLPPDERKEKYNEAMAKAKKLAATASPKEQALINALTSRYSTDLTKDVAELNMAYMNAMTEVPPQIGDTIIATIIYFGATSVFIERFLDNSKRFFANRAFVKAEKESN